MSRHSVSLEVSLDEFDPVDIIAAARELGFEIPEAFSMGELAFAIERGDKVEAFRNLAILVADDAQLINAIEVGRRRVR